jgi:hypothetical protein
MFMHRAMFMMVPCMRSVLPLRDWFLAPLRCRTTPVRLQNRSTLSYSPLESVRKTWTL